MSIVASVAVEKTSLHFDRLFDYIVPENLSADVKEGCFVSVPFGQGNKIRQGMVIEIKNCEPNKRYKKLLSLLGKGPVLSHDLLNVVKYLRSTCFCTWYEAIRTVLPSGLFFRINECWNFNFIEGLDYSQDEIDVILRLKKLSDLKSINKAIEKFINEGNAKTIQSLKKKGVLFQFGDSRRKICDKRISMVRALNSQSFDGKLTAKQNKLLNFIEESGSVSVKEACYICGVTEIVLKNLLKYGLVEIFERETYRNPYKNVKITKSVDDILLTKKQQEAANGLIGLMDSNKACVSLLRGVTGSGKTQVFLKLIKHTLDKGKHCILMVPEISLTPQILSFFQSLFGDNVAVFHSAISMAEQLDEYKRISRGEANVVIGTRSAVFAPCKNLGLIIMDEEGEHTYKSSDLNPRYHARDVAKYRCFKSSSMLLLASATPSIETQYYAKIGKYHEFVLDQRYGNAKLPEVMIVDLKKAQTSQVAGVSEMLAEELLKNIENGEQSILLLNRRGYNSSAVCIDCGWVAHCPNCTAPMTYHKANDSLMCHYCGHIQGKIENCPICGQDHILYQGHGTQKIEEELKRTFFKARVLRLDADSTFTRKVLEDKIKSFENGEYDILIGTQIVAKGLNFPNVTLVGVLFLDSMLYGADFRCHEQLFSLLTQVVGRSGRGDKVGRAIIQTYKPDNQTILQAAKQDYEMFYRDEILERKSFFCPPFCDLCMINFSGLEEVKVQKCAEEVVKLCKKFADENVPIRLLGIATPYFSRLNKRYRRRIIIKCHNTPNFRAWMRKVIGEALDFNLFSKIRVNIDINGDII